MVSRIQFARIVQYEDVLRVHSNGEDRVDSLVFRFESSSLEAAFIVRRSKAQSRLSIVNEYLSRHSSRHWLWKNVRHKLTMY